MCGEGGALLDPRRPDASARGRDPARERAPTARRSCAASATATRGSACGSSYVLSELLAPIAVVQFQKLPEITRRKTAQAERLLAAPRAVPRRRPVAGRPRQGCRPNWHVFAVLVDPARRDWVLKALRAGGRERGVPLCAAALRAVRAAVAGHRRRWIYRSPIASRPRSSVSRFRRPLPTRIATTSSRPASRCSIGWPPAHEDRSPGRLVFSRQRRRHRGVRRGSVPAPACGRSRGAVAAPDAHHAAPERYEHDRRAGVSLRDPEPRRRATRHTIAFPSAAPSGSPAGWRTSVPTSCTCTASRPASGCPKSAKRVASASASSSPAHLPGFGYMCRTGELMQWGRVPVRRHRRSRTNAQSCNLTRLGMPQPARAAGRRAIPLPLSSALGAASRPHRHDAGHGRVGGRVPEHAARAVRAGRAFVVLNETGRRMLISNGSPAEKMSLNRLGVSQSAVARKPSATCVRPKRPCASATSAGCTRRKD